MRVKLKELGTISTGSTPSKNVSEFYDSADIGFVKPDLISDSQIDYIDKTAEYLSEAARMKARIVKRNAVFVTCIGSIGKIGIAKNDELAFNQQINAIEPSEKVNPKYLAYSIFANKKKLQAIANAPVVPIINKTQFGEFEIDITDDVEEQARIVALLDKVRVIIDDRKKELEKLDELVKARFVELFGDPIMNSSNLPTERMELRFNLKAGIITAAEDIHDFEEEVYEVPCYGGNGIRGYVKEKSYTGNYPIIGRQGALCGNVQYATGDFHATEHAVLVSLLKDDNSVWVYHLLKMMDLYRYHTGAAQPGLAVKTLNAVDVIVADKSKQDTFAAFVAQVDKSKAVVKKALDKAQLLFDSLMQQYFG